MAEEKKLSELERNRMETEMLKKRSLRCVCKFCGGPLVPSLIIYNKYGGQGIDLYCPNCELTEFGTEPQVHALAKKFVDTFEFNYYLDMEENERNYMLNIGKITEIFSWAFRQIGIMDKEGFTETPADFTNFTKEK